MIDKLEFIIQNKNIDLSEYVRRSMISYIKSAEDPNEQ